MITATSRKVKKDVERFDGEWEIKQLGDLLAIRHGRSQRDVESPDGPYPILASGGQIGTASQALYDKPSVLIGRKGTIDQPQFMDSPFWTVDTLFYSEIKDDNDAKFLYFRFLLIDWRQHNEASGVPSLSSRNIENLQVLTPIPNEQRAIANVLSDVDELIDSLDALIAKKRDMKQGAMQQLLTCKTRLPGFDGEWDSVKLSSISHIQAGINKNIEQMGSGFLYVTVKDAYEDKYINVETLGRIALTDSEKKFYSLQIGDIIFGKSSVKREGIGFPSLFSGCIEDVVFSGFTFCSRALIDRVIPEYLFYYLRFEPTRQWVISNSQASALTNMNRGIADQIPIRLPSLKEQRAIATILSDMDTEIEALENRKAKTVAIKQGMMQVLLTGKTRLPKTECA